MKSKNSLFFIMLLLFFAVFAKSFAQQGVMSGAGKLRVSQTQWFDIIYAQENEPTAQILYEKADEVYRKLAATYGIEPYLRIPVVITSKVEQFNAYQTNSPYCCIVIYDTAVIPELAVFSETVISTFTHELTHALTYNHKSPLMRSLAKIFGDGFAAYYLSVTSGMAEGATVSYESSEGEGRLNDAYILQMLRQAKIEGSFPSYSDVKGASDTYPANSFYYFNGAFADFLQRNFGMDKYAEFWYRCVNGINLTAAGAFKKTFDFKLSQAWKLFQDRFKVPQVPGANPVELGQASDFFNPSLKKYSLNNSAGSLYSNLCLSEQGLYYIDSSHNWVYFVDAGQLKEGGAVKPKKLFRHDYIDYLKVSQDGRFAAVGYYSTLSSNVKHCAAIYDLKNKSWFTIPETNIVNPSVIYDQGRYYVIMQKYQSQKYSISVKKLIADKKIKGLEPYAGMDLAAEEVPFDFTGLGDGRFAFIKKAGLEYSVCLSSLDCRELVLFEAPLKGMKLQNLSAENSEAGVNRLTFSWAVKETLPRYGFLDLKDNCFALSDQNISGGIYYPLLQSSSKLFYIGQFYRQNRILILKEGEEKFKYYEARPFVNAEAAETAEAAGAEKAGELPYKPFNPFAYAFKGLLLPVSSAVSSNFMNFGSVSSYSCLLGFTYATSLPWTTGIFTTSAGYGFDTGSGVFSFDYQGGTGTSLFTYDLASSLELDKHGFKQASGNISLSSGFDFGTRYAMLFSANAGLNYGRVSYSDSKGKVVNNNMDIYFKNFQTLVATFSNVVRTGPGAYERGGFTFSAGLVHSASSKVKPQKYSFTDLYDFVMGANIYLPRLLPLRCVDNFTYNLPVKIMANLFPMNGGGFSAAQVNAEALLFSYDIQRAMPGISALYINDISLILKYNFGSDFADSADYNVNWHIAYLNKYIKQAAEGKLKYRDYATIKASLGFTPNVGAFADSQFRNNLYISWSFGKKANLPASVFDFGLEAKF